MPPTYSVKTADVDETVYEKTEQVSNVRTFTIAQLDAEIAQQNEVIAAAQARIVKIEDDKTKALAVK